MTLVSLTLLLMLRQISFVQQLVAHRWLKTYQKHVVLVVIWHLTLRLFASSPCFSELQILSIQYLTSFSESIEDLILNYFKSTAFGLKAIDHPSK